MNIGMWKWFGLLLAVLFGLTSFFGCGAKMYAVNADDGTHKTHWNHGLVLEWGTKIYIGPGSGSYTDVEHKWNAHIEGDGYDTEEDDESPGANPDGADHSDRVSGDALDGRGDNDMGLLGAVGNRGGGCDERAKHAAYS